MLNVVELCIRYNDGTKERIIISAWRVKEFPQRKKQFQPHCGNKLEICYVEKVRKEDVLGKRNSV